MQKLAAVQFARFDQTRRGLARFGFLVRSPCALRSSLFFANRLQSARRCWKRGGLMRACSSRVGAVHLFSSRNSSHTRPSSLWRLFSWRAPSAACQSGSAGCGLAYDDLRSATHHPISARTQLRPGRGQEEEEEEEAASVREPRVRSASTSHAGKRGSRRHLQCAAQDAVSGPGAGKRPTRSIEEPCSIDGCVVRVA